MEYLILDGYNIINAWKDLFDLDIESLEDCRDRLANMMSNYQGLKKISVVIVFDAHFVKGSLEKEYTFDNIKIVYTKENEAADNYIEKFVYQLGNIHTIRVVTSDYLEQTMIMSSGGIRMSPRELRAELDTAARSMKPVLFPNKVKTNAIESHVKPEILSKLEELRRGKFLKNQ